MPSLISSTPSNRNRSLRPWRAMTNTRGNSRRHHDRPLWGRSFFLSLPATRTRTMNATATQQGKPRAKPARKIRLVLPLDDEGRNGIISIASGKQVDEYFLDQLFTDYGDGFE